MITPHETQPLPQQDESVTLMVAMVFYEDGMVHKLWLPIRRVSLQDENDLMERTRSLLPSVATNKVMMYYELQKNSEISKLWYHSPVTGWFLRSPSKEEEDEIIERID